MKRNSILTLILIATTILSACGAAPAEPTLSPENIQSTAVAAAFTIIAQTQAAIPTNTPLPPTETPLPTAIPTNTPVPAPTLDPLLAAPTFTVAAPVIAAPPTSTTSADPCNQLLGAIVSGHETKIRLTNQTKGELVVSLYLNKTAFGECGYRGYNLSKNDSLTIYDLPQGCYNVGVFVTLPDKSSKAFGYGCINNSDLWEFSIYEESVILAPP